MNPKDKCNREGCNHKAIFCFLMWDLPDPKQDGYNWRLDLCEQCSDDFRLNPDRGYEGIENRIRYEGI